MRLIAINLCTALIYIYNIPYNTFNIPYFNSEGFKRQNLVKHTFKKSTYYGNNILGKYFCYEV